jgi:hypothetical protein
LLSTIGDEGQIDRGRKRRGKLALGPLDLVLEAAERQVVFAQIDTVGFLEAVGDVIDDGHIQVVAPEAAVAGRQDDLEGVVVDVENGEVEGAAAEIVNRDGFLAVSCPDHRPWRRPWAR